MPHWFHRYDQGWMPPASAGPATASSLSAALKRQRATGSQPAAWMRSPTAATGSAARRAARAVGLLAKAMDRLSSVMPALLKLGTKPDPLVIESKAQSRDTPMELNLGRWPAVLCLTCSKVDAATSTLDLASLILALMVLMFMGSSRTL